MIPALSTEGEVHVCRVRSQSAGALEKRYARQSIYAVVILASMTMASATHSQSCPIGEKRLRQGDECIPKTLFNYLYCLERSGGGKVEVTQKSGDEDSRTLEIQVSGRGSGVVLKGEGGGGFKKDDVTKATKELQEKLDPSLAAKCERLSAVPRTTGQSKDDPHTKCWNGEAYVGKNMATNPQGLTIVFHGATGDGRGNFTLKNRRLEFNGAVFTSLSQEVSVGDIFGYVDNDNLSCEFMFAIIAPDHAWGWSYDRHK